jgi:hypothetical protein
MFGLPFLITKQIRLCHFYFLNTKDVKKFDSIPLPTYQITDNQKTTLKINKNGVVLNKGEDYDYSCFNNKFYNDWNALEIKTEQDIKR